MIEKYFITLLTACAFCLEMIAGTKAFTSSNTAYALISDDNTTLTFYCDALMAEREGTVCLIDTENPQQAWSEVLGQVEQVVFDESFAQASCTDISQWFEGMENLAVVEGLQYIDTSDLTNMDRLFRGCSSLTVIDFSSLLISPEISTSLMFDGCVSLDTLKINGSFSDISDDACQGVGSGGHHCVIIADNDFDFWVSTSAGNVEWKSGSFTLPPLVPYAVIEGDAVYSTMTFFCDRNPYTLSDEEKALSEYHFLADNDFERTWEFPNDDGDQVTVDVLFDPSFVSARPTSTASWFYTPVNSFTLEPDVVFNFTGLEYLNTSMVNDMSNMFNGCTTVSELNLDGFDTSNVEQMEGMFMYCLSFTTLDLSGFSTSNVTNMSRMFYGCRGLKSLNLSQMKTGNVTDMSEMFYGCTQLTGLDLSLFNTAEVTDMHCMFANCSSLESLNLASFATSNVSNMEGMFARCQSLASVNLSSFNTSSVTDMSGMFYLCPSLTALTLDNFDTSSVEDMGNMFGGCSSLKKLDLSMLDMSNVGNYESVQYYFMDDEDDLTLETFDGFLYGCTALDSLLIPSSMVDLPEDAFYDVGVLKPCVLIVPDDYVFDGVEITDPLLWLGGTFILNRLAAEMGTFSVEMNGMLAGGEGSLVVSYVNGYVVYNGLQFELHLPEGVTLAKDGSHFAYTLDERCGEMTATIRDFGNGSYRILCYSMSNAILQGTSGPVITLQLTAGEDIPSGIYEGYVTNIVFSRLDGESEIVENISFDVSVDNFPKGDVDHDYLVNILDVMLVINHVLGVTGSNFHEESADMNRDGRIDVTDVMAIVVTILNKRSMDRSAVAVAGSPAPFSVLPSDEGMVVSMQNDGGYTACQMKVEVPAGEEAVSFLPGNSAAGYSVMSQKIGLGEYNVVVCSLQGTELKCDSPLIRIVTASGNACDVRMTDITLVDRDLHEVQADDVEAVATGVYAAGMERTEGPAYRIDGVRCGSMTRGLQVKNGKKYLVR